MSRVILSLLLLPTILAKTWPWESNSMENDNFKPKYPEYPEEAWSNSAKPFSQTNQYAQQDVPVNPADVCTKLDYWQFFDGIKAVDWSKLIPDWSKILDNPFNLIQPSGNIPLYRVEAAGVTLRDLNNLLQKVKDKHPKSIVTVHCSRFLVEEADLQSETLSCPDPRSIPLRYNVPENIKLYIVTGIYQTFSFAENYTANCNPKPLHTVVGNVRIQAGEVRGWSVTANDENKPAFYLDPTLKTFLAPKVPTHAFFLWFSCARRLAGYNLHSTPRQDAFLAYNIAKEVGDLGMMGNSILRTLATKSYALAAKLNDIFRFQKTSTLREFELRTGLEMDITKLPSNLSVPYWSMDTFTTRLQRLSLPITDYLTNFTNSLQPSIAVDIRKQYLAFLAEVMKRSGQDYTFEVQQAMANVQAFKQSIYLLDVQVKEATKTCKTALDTFQAGVKTWRGWQIAGQVVGFFTSVLEVVGGLFSGSPGTTMRGFSDLFNNLVNLDKFLQQLEQLQTMIDKVREMDDLKLNLPLETTDLNDFMQKALNGNLDPASVKTTRDALLKLSSFDRSALESGIAAYDIVGESIHTMMQGPKDKLIGGAMDLDTAYQSLSVVGQAYMQARLNYHKAMLDYGLKLDTVLTALRQGQVFQDTINNLDNDVKIAQQQASANGIPGYVNAYTELMDTVSAICEAYLYAEARDPPAVSISDLPPYSLDVAKYQINLVTFINKFQRSQASRQSWKVKIVLNEADPLAKPILYSLKTTGRTVIPSSFMYKDRELSSTVAATCMISCGVELTGAVGKPIKDNQPWSPGDLAYVAFDIYTSGVNVGQRSTDSGKWMTFTTSSTKYRGSYNLGDEQLGEDGGIFWTISPETIDKNKKFCRTPYQDVVLVNLQNSKGPVDISKVTSLTLHLSGTAVMTGRRRRGFGGLEKSQVDELLGVKLEKRQAVAMDLYASLERCLAPNDCEPLLISPSKAFQLLSVVDDYVWARELAVDQQSQSLHKCSKILMSVCYNPVGVSAYEYVYFDKTLYFSNGPDLMSCTMEKCVTLVQGGQPFRLFRDSANILYFAWGKNVGACDLNNGKCVKRLFMMDQMSVNQFMGMVGDDIMISSSRYEDSILQIKVPMYWYVLDSSQTDVETKTYVMEKTNFKIPDQFSQFYLPVQKDKMLYFTSGDKTVFKCDVTNTYQPSCSIFVTLDSQVMGMTYTEKLFITTTNKVYEGSGTVWLDMSSSSQEATASIFVDNILYVSLMMKKI